MNESGDCVKAEVLVVARPPLFVTDEELRQLLCPHAGRTDSGGYSGNWRTGDSRESTGCFAAATGRPCAPGWTAIKGLAMVGHSERPKTARNTGPNTS